MMNPYASFLGDRNPQEVIGATAGKLRHYADVFGSRRLGQPPAPGKWSTREIICHLADCEIVFAYRLRQALAEDHHTIQPFDQDTWAKSYAAYDGQAALAVFSSVRQWNIAFIKAIPPESLKKKVTHPERGEMTIQTVIETMAGHDLNHLVQIETMAKKLA
ncbi:MAG TPA: DinB family protein [Candidatus Limnocylindrales bacterium]|nr:DinB family protein [Candidatus Limnocylindrales bacterium]